MTSQASRSTVSASEVQLGRSGLRVSRVGLGCNNFGGRLNLEGSRAVIHAALDAGITFFDTADVYGNKGASESILGEVLGSRRQDIVLATKFGNPMDEAGRLRGGSRWHVTSAVEASLRRLKTDWIDLYQLHKPDPTTPIEETLKALDDLVRSGKVRYIGASNLGAWQVVEAQWLARELGTERFISSQDEYSLLKRDAEQELIPALRSYQLGLLPFFPLANGLLTGKYRRGKSLPEGARLSQGGSLAERYLTADHLTKVERLHAFAVERGRSLLELAFSWLASQPVVGSIIAGASTPEQVRANVEAPAWRLEDSDLREIDRLLALPVGA